MKLAILSILLISHAIAAAPLETRNAYISFTPKPHSEVPDGKRASGVVSVRGMVNDPKEIQVEVFISVSDAILGAGGFNRVSLRGEFSIIGQNGTIRWRGPEIGSKGSELLYDRLILFPGDVLFVHEVE